MTYSLHSAALDDELNKSVESFYRAYQAHPPRKAISRSQLHALVSHTTGAGWKGLQTLVNHQKKRDQTNKETSLKQNPGKPPKEGNYEPFWLLWSRFLEKDKEDGQDTLKGLCDQVADSSRDALCLLFVGRVAAKLMFAATLAKKDGNDGKSSDYAPPKTHAPLKNDALKNQFPSKKK